MEETPTIVIPLFILIVVVILFLFINKIDIDWGSILRKTIPLDRGVFGVYCYDGKQGSGKTYALVKYLNQEASRKKIYSNIQLMGTVEYEPLRDLDHLLSLRDEKNVIIVYDEILNFLNDKAIPRNIRDELFEFLTQQRKMKNILFTTTQEWLNVPIEFRRFVRVQIICRTIPLGFLGGILIQEYRNAYEMEYDNMQNEYIAPRISLKISKYEARIMQSYDTYERVKKLKRKSE